MPDQLQPIVQRMIDAGESEENIATVIQHFKSGPGADYGPATPAPVSRAGLATSVLAPELEAVRGSLNAATETPHGQPIMARSRTGALYASETGTGAVNAGKNLARGFGSEVINTVEGATSPLGIGAMAAPAIVRQAAAKLPIAGALRMSASVLESSPKIRKWVPFADAAAQNARTLAQGTQDAQMGVTRGAAQYEMPHAEQRIVDRGSARLPYPAATEGVAATEAAAPSISAADRAMLVKQGLTPEGIAKFEAQLSGQPSPMTGTLRMTPPPAAHPPIQVNEASLPADWHTAVPDQVGHALDPARVDIGAQATGRAAGMTKQQVRDVATPILDAAPGEASPILPEAALKRMIDTLKALPKGGPERDAYVARATSGKTQWQVENIRRTLEHLGLVVPAATGGGVMVRDALMQRLSGAGSQQPQD